MSLDSAANPKLKFRVIRVIFAQEPHIPQFELAVVFVEVSLRVQMEELHF